MASRRKKTKSKDESILVRKQSATELFSQHQNKKSHKEYTKNKSGNGPRKISKKYFTRKMKEIPEDSFKKEANEIEGNIPLKKMNENPNMPFIKDQTEQSLQKVYHKPCDKTPEKCLEKRPEKSLEKKTNDSTENSHQIIGSSKNSHKIIGSSQNSHKIIGSSQNFSKKLIIKTKAPSHRRKNDITTNFLNIEPPKETLPMKRRRVQRKKSTSQSEISQKHPYFNVINKKKKKGPTNISKKEPSNHVFQEKRCHHKSHEQNHSQVDTFAETSPNSTLLNIQISTKQSHIDLKEGRSNAMDELKQYENIVSTSASHFEQINTPSCSKHTNKTIGNKDGPTHSKEKESQPPQLNDENHLDKRNETNCHTKKNDETDKIITKASNPSEQSLQTVIYKKSSRKKHIPLKQHDHDRKSPRSKHIHQIKSEHGQHLLNFSIVSNDNFEQIDPNVDHNMSSKTDCLNKNDILNESNVYDLIHMDSRKGKTIQVSDQEQSDHDTNQMNRIFRQELSNSEKGSDSPCLKMNDNSKHVKEEMSYETKLHDQKQINKDINGKKTIKERKALTKKNKIPFSFDESQKYVKESCTDFFEREHLQNNVYQRHQGLEHRNILNQIVSDKNFSKEVSSPVKDCSDISQRLTLEFIEDLNAHDLNKEKLVNSFGNQTDHYKSEGNKNNDYKGDIELSESNSKARNHVGSKISFEHFQKEPFFDFLDEISDQACEEPEYKSQVNLTQTTKDKSSNEYKSQVSLTQAAKDKSSNKYKSQVNLTQAAKDKLSNEIQSKSEVKKDQTGIKMNNDCSAREIKRDLQIIKAEQLQGKLDSETKKEQNGMSSNDSRPSQYKKDNISMRKNNSQKQNLPMKKNECDFELCLIDFLEDGLTVNDDRIDLTFKKGAEKMQFECKCKPACITVESPTKQELHTRKKITKLNTRKNAGYDNILIKTSKKVYFKSNEKESKHKVSLKGDEVLHGKGKIKFVPWTDEFVKRMLQSPKPSEPDSNMNVPQEICSYRSLNEKQKNMNFRNIFENITLFDQDSSEDQTISSKDQTISSKIAFSETITERKKNILKEKPNYNKSRKKKNYYYPEKSKKEIVVIKRYVEVNNDIGFFYTMK